MIILLGSLFAVATSIGSYVALAVAGAFRD
jgi:hypothetical protein